MIITIPITDVAELTIGVTDQMQRDLKECARMAETLGDGKDCETCSWDKQEFDRTGFCEMPAVVDKVLGGDD